MLRRRFLTSAAGAGGAGLVTTLFGPETIRRVEAASRQTAGRDPEEVARDESYWSEIQQAFSVSRSIINLNNGGVCPSPRMVTEAFVRYTWQQEEAPVYTMWQLLQPRKENVRQRLARMFGCDPEEVALVRNTSEAMEILLLGMELQSGDEVLTTTQDYGRMITTLRQRSRREGIEIRFIQVPVPAETDEEIVVLVVDCFRVGVLRRAPKLAPRRPQSLVGGGIDACEQIEEFLAGRGGEQGAEQAVGVGPHRVVVRDAWRHEIASVQVGPDV